MMYSKQRKLPLEVSSWMEKDLTLKKVSANSRLLTNDTRQNIILNRQFFSDLLNLSFARYRKMAEYDFNKRTFLKNQEKKSESTMPGLRPYVDQLNYTMSRPATSRIPSSRHGDRLYLSQSFLSRSNTKFDPRYHRQIRTAQIRRSPVEASPTPTTDRQMSRERLNRLAQPKGYRYKSAPSDQVRSNTSEGTETVEEIISKLDQASSVTSPEKPKSAVHDQRFHHLMHSFSRVHTAKPSHFQTVQSIVQANPSLQDDEGQWKTEHPIISGRKAELIHHRQMLAEKLHNRVDIFLIDIGA